jgi:CubicO group peptidase (beta-lactamase class C family)
MVRITRQEETVPRLTRVLWTAALGAAAVGLVGGTALYLAAPHPPRTPDRLRDAAELDGYLARLVASGNPPGLSAAVVKDGRVVYERAFGLGDGPRGVAATPDTVYHWWSMTKIPTAMAVMQLASADRLGLDAPVTAYLPWFEVEYPSARSTAVTVRHLLTHSSGLPDTMPSMIGWVHHDAAPRDQTALARRHLSAHRKLRFEPGSDAAYSNLNYIVLGALIEQVTGRPYERYVVDEVLRPLGMARTDFVYTPELAAHEAAGSLPVVHVYTPLLPFLLDARALVRERRGGLLWLNRVYVDANPPSGLIGPARPRLRRPRRSARVAALVRATRLLHRRPRSEIGACMST